MLGVVVGCAMLAATGVVTKNMAVIETASARAIFRLRDLDFATFKDYFTPHQMSALWRLVCHTELLNLTAPPVLNSRGSCVKAEKCESLLTVKGYLWVAHGFHISFG